MTTEWGALVGWFPVDAVTIAYLEGRNLVLRKHNVRRITEMNLLRWRTSPPAPDKDAVYAGRILLNLDEVTPHVSGPDTVQAMQSLAEIEQKKVAIQKAYLVSCVNSRLEDLSAAARVLHGNRIAPGVKLYVGAASMEVEDEAIKHGVWRRLLNAGAEPLPPGCGPCIGLGAGLLEPGEVGISATNRNFKGRMGSRDAQCYLASPEVVAASAVAGYICGPASVPAREMQRRFESVATPLHAEEAVEILPGFPERLSGRLLFLPQDNLNTDGIYGKDYTYREDMTAEMMAKVVMQNYDPGFAQQARPDDIIVGGSNFGTGSSREQAVTALKCAGIPLVIAASFSQTYLRNAFNNGFLCIEAPELVGFLRQQFAENVAAGEKTIVAPAGIEVDFATGTILHCEEQFSFQALGSVPQSLVIAGGIENLVTEKLKGKLEPATV
jgi:homoaconitate hydratase